MKRLKSLLSLALVLVMVLSFAVPAMAADTYRWPIVSKNTVVSNKPDVTDFYAVLRCLDCNKSEANKYVNLTNASATAGEITQGYGYAVCEVTVDASCFVIDKNHTLVSTTPQKMILTKSAGSSRWTGDPVVFYVTCDSNHTQGTPTPGTGSYSIDYVASGNWPYGVSVPTDYKSYKYGDKVTLQNPSKTVIADYVGGMPGYWVFNGWTVVSDNDYYYSNTSNKYNHSSKCGYYNGKWYCDKSCWYCDYDYKYDWRYQADDELTYLDILKYCREEGIRLADLKIDDLPLTFKVTNNYSTPSISYKPTNVTTNVTASTSVTSANGPYYTGSCGHSWCTGKYCDVYYACDHDECPREYCKYWYSKGHVCSHTSCPDSYCKYWDDCDYYSYYYGYYYPTQTITVTGNMTVYGSWSFQPAGGTLVISASTLAASEYKPESYTFEIYSANNSTKPVKTVTVKAGSNQYVSLDNGTYYIYAVNANVNGYDLDVTVSGDVSTDGAKIVMKGDAVQVKYSHLYTDGDLEFTTDHVAYLTGFSDGTIRPNDYITREQVATILYRLLTPESRAAYETTTNKFSDVKETRWSNTAISTLANAGVLGNTHSTFRPAENMTRAELINALVEITGVSGGRVAFSDTAGHWASSALNAAANEGWITGYADGTCEPDGFLTRAEVAVIINRVLDRNPGSVADLAEGMQTFTDNMKTTKWYYLDIQEAANGHTYKRDTDGSEYWTGLSK